METNYIREYLVKLGIDFSAAKFKEVEDSLNSIDKSIMKFFKNWNHTAIAFSKSYTRIIKQILNFGISVSKYDMDMQRWAKTMYITADSAKALDRTLSAMGLDVEDLRDVALNQELTKQYKELLSLSKSLTLGREFQEAARGFRSINFEFQKASVIWENFKDRIINHLWKFMQSSEGKNLVNLLSRFNSWGMSVMDRVARVIGNSLGGLVTTFTRILSLGRSLYREVILPSIDFIKSLPREVKGVLGILSQWGLAVMAGPFGKILFLVQLIDELIEDIQYFYSGKRSFIGEILMPAMEKPMYKVGDWLWNIFGSKGNQEPFSGPTWSFNPNILKNIEADILPPGVANMDEAAQEAYIRETLERNITDRHVENYYISGENADEIAHKVAAIRNNRGVFA